VAELELAEVICGLRAELQKAVADGADEDLRFRLDPLQLTLQVVVTNEVGAGIGWKVISLGGKHDAATTQTLVLQLTPVVKGPDGEYSPNFLVSSVVPAGDTI